MNQTQGNRHYLEVKAGTPSPTFVFLEALEKAALIIPKDLELSPEDREMLTKALQVTRVLKRTLALLRDNLSSIATNAKAEEKRMVSLSLIVQDPEAKRLLKNMIREVRKVKRAVEP